MVDLLNNATGFPGADGKDDSLMQGGKKTPPAVGDVPTPVVTPGAASSTASNPQVLKTPGAYGSPQWSPGSTQGVVYPGRAEPAYWTANEQNDEIQGFLATANRDQVKAMSKTLNAAGFNNTGKEASIVTAYHKAVYQSAFLKDTEGKPALTVGDFLDWKIANGGGGAGNKVASGSSGPDLSPTSSIQLTGDFDAKALVNNALNGYLGRTATEKEISNFHSMLNKAEAANPTITTHQGLHATTTKAGGANGQELAKEFALSRDDYAETQASTTLMGWLQKSIMKTDQERII